METPELKTTKMKNFIHWIGSTVDLRGQKEESVSLKIDSSVKIIQSDEQRGKN